MKRITEDMAVTFREVKKAVLALTEELGRNPDADEIYKYFGVNETRKKRVLVVLVGGAGSNMYQDFNEMLVGQELADFEFLFIDSINRKDFITKIFSEVKSLKANYLPLNVAELEAELQNNKGEVSFCMRDKDIVAIIAGMGGMVGSNVTPYVLKIARETPAVKNTLLSIIMPFRFEGKDRMNTAVTVTNQMVRECDSMKLWNMNESIQSVDRNTKIIDLLTKENKNIVSDMIERIKEQCSDEQD